MAVKAAQRVVFKKSVSPVRIVTVRAINPEDQDSESGRAGISRPCEHSKCSLAGARVAVRGVLVLLKAAFGHPQLPTQAQRSGKKLFWSHLSTPARDHLKPAQERNEINGRGPPPAGGMPLPGDYLVMGRW